MLALYRQTLKKISNSPIAVAAAFTMATGTSLGIYCIDQQANKKRRVAELELRILRIRQEVEQVRGELLDIELNYQAEKMEQLCSELELKYEAKEITQLCSDIDKSHKRVKKYRL